MNLLECTPFSRYAVEGRRCGLRDEREQEEARDQEVGPHKLLSVTRRLNLL